MDYHKPALLGNTQSLRIATMLYGYLEAWACCFGVVSNHRTSSAEWDNLCGFCGFGSMPPPMAHVRQLSMTKPWAEKVHGMKPSAQTKRRANHATFVEMRHTS